MKSVRTMMMKSSRRKDKIIVIFDDDVQRTNGVTSHEIRKKSKS